MGNAMFVIQPYKNEGIWAFDDASRNLVREPFVFGVPEMIEAFVANISGAERGFRLYFSQKPFPGYQAKLVWQQEEYEGNWYRLEAADGSSSLTEPGWLCPALFKYFDAAPSEIYCKVEPAATSTGTHS